MPKLERLDWLDPPGAGRGVTITDQPEVNLWLYENPAGLMIGVLLDSQYRTKAAFASPYYLWQRLGHLDMPTIANFDPDEFKTVFKQPNALHRFPNKFADLTQRLARHVTDNYEGWTERIWVEATGTEDLGQRLLGLPAFGIEKTNWTIGMLGRLEMLPFDGWQEYRVTKGRKKPPKTS